MPDRTWTPFTCPLWRGESEMGQPAIEAGRTQARRNECAVACDLCGSAEGAVRFGITFGTTGFWYGVCETCLQQGTPGDFLVRVRSMWEKDREEADRQILLDLSPDLSVGLSPEAKRHWRKIRRKVLARANHRCEQCGSVESLVVHHLTDERAGAEEMDDLRVLCRSCRTAVHGGPAK